MWFKRIWRHTLLLAVIGLTLFGIVNRQDILDWLRLRGYQPPARIAQIAKATTMNDYGKRLFYVHHPELDDKKTFGSHCPVNEETIVLGCYITHLSIYILDVKDDRLEGVHEVTAAHEMLHAAYDRLSEAEKKRIGSQLIAFAKTIKKKRLLETIETYRQRDPSVITNELHSIIGTEVRKLTPELEKYYSRYFSNRIKIVEFSEKYENAFEQIKRQVEAYDQQLEALKEQIDANNARLKQMASELESDRRQLDAYAASGNTSAYNAGVPSYNQKVRDYNNLRAQTEELINQYNQIVKQRNALAAEQQELINAIDSRIQTL